LIQNVVLDVMTVGVSSWAWVYSWPMGQAARFCVQEAGPGVEYMCGPEYWVSQSCKKLPKIAAHTEGIMTQKQNLTAAGIALHTAIAKNHGPLLSAVSSFLLAGVGKILLHGKEQEQSPAWRGNGRARPPEAPTYVCPAPSRESGLKSAIICSSNPLFRTGMI